MKKVENPTRERILAILMPLPLVLTMAFAVAFLLGAPLFFAYSVALTVALKSAMAFLIVFATSLISLGFGLLLLHGFFVYKKYYEQKKNNLTPAKAPKAQTEKTFKDFLTVQNLALVFLLVGAACAIVSAALGAINREKWVKTVSPYMQQNGYYADVEYREYRYATSQTDGVQQIHVDLDGKQAVVIYTEDAQRQDFVFVCGYEKYVSQLKVSKNGDTLTIAEGERPSLDGALEKMLFFMFDENKIENQVKIYVPKVLKDTIQIDGEYIVAQ